MDVPTNLVSLVLFVVLLAPGLVSITWRSFRPIRKPTVLGELAGLVFRSLICDVLALGVFAWIHVVWPQWTPDVGALIRTQTYIRENFALVAWWSLGLLVLACLFAYIGAQIWTKVTTGRGKFFEIFKKLVPGEVVAYQPAWWELLSVIQPDHLRYVGCVLDDDTYIAGYLHSYNPMPDETGDRELTLVAPITLRSPGEDTANTLGGKAPVGAICISARRIQYFTVSYLPKQTKKEQLPGVPPGSDATVGRSPAYPPRTEGSATARAANSD
jgi:hypothetical protein